MSDRAIDAIYDRLRRGESVASEEIESLEGNPHAVRRLLMYRTERMEWERLSGTAKIPFKLKWWNNEILGYDRVQVEPGSEEWMHVMRGVDALTVVTNIERVQNPAVRLAYEQKLRTMSDHTQLWLWHGTEVVTAYQISLTNIDPRMNGKNATMYGKGAYFSTNFGYSKTYCYGRGSRRRMFKCLVAVGKHNRNGTMGMRRPPPGFDSVTGPGMHIVFEGAQIYPAYVLTYKA